MTDIFQKQLGDVIADFESACKRNLELSLKGRNTPIYPSDTSSVLSKSDVRDLQTRCVAAIERTSGRDSTYYKHAIGISETVDNVNGHLAGQIGVARSLLSDLKNGYLKTLEEIIHGDVFSDFLEMAAHLCESGYKDAAAVIAGSTLEAHLRQLCNKHGVPTEREVHGKIQALKADSLNADLCKADAYTKLDQKSVTAWLGLRNKAAHGRYDEYQKEQVDLLISSIRDFISRMPA